MLPGQTKDCTSEQIANLRDQIQQFEEEIKRWATRKSDGLSSRE